MSHNWHYVKGGDKHGPITEAGLKELVKTGQLSPDDFVWREDMKDWIKAGAVKGLFPPTVVQPQTKTSPPPMPQTMNQSNGSTLLTPKRLLLTFVLFTLLIAILLPLVKRARDAARLSYADHQRKNTKQETGQVDEALSERYLPQNSKTTHVFLTWNKLGDIIRTSKVEKSYQSANIISNRMLSHFALNLKDNQSGDLPIIDLDDDLRRINDGFIQMKNSGFIGREEDGWAPQIKIGARIGDSWLGMFDGQKYKFIGYSKERLNDDIIDCAVIEETISSRIKTRTVRLYQKDVGLISEETYMIEGSEEKPVNKLFRKGLRTNKNKDY